jgi:isopentenyl-diphosphate delta-isomerase
VLPNAIEVNDYLFKPMKEIKEELPRTPEKYTAWFQVAFVRIEAWWKERYSR